MVYPQFIGECCKYVNIPGMSLKKVSGPPASITSTFTEGISERPFAITVPAAPAPTIIKSYFPISAKQILIYNNNDYNGNNIDNQA